MRCPYCDSKINENDTYCPNCGNNIDGIQVKENNESLTKQKVEEKEVRIDPIKPSKYLFTILAYFGIMYFGVILIQFFLISIINKENPNYENLLSVWTQIITYAVMVIVLGFMVFKALKQDTLYFPKDIGKIMLWSLIGLVGIYTISFALSFFYQKIIGLQGDSQNQETIVVMLKNNPLVIKIIYCVIIVVAGPLVEEIVYRKCIFGFLSKNKKLKSIWIIIISGLIFGFIHVASAIIQAVALKEWSTIRNELLFSLDYIAMGVLFALVYEKANRNIYASYIPHLINNLISVLIIFF